MKGGPTGDRTLNPRIKSPLLCQLSYRPATDHSTAAWGEDMNPPSWGIPVLLVARVLVITALLGARGPEPTIPGGGTAARRAGHPALNRPVDPAGGRR